MLRHRLLGTLSVLGIFAAPLQGQSTAISLALAHTTSPVDTIRQQSMTELRRAGTAAHVDVCTPSVSPAVKKTLIDALASENARIFDRSSSFGEAEGEGFHAALRDPRVG